MSIYWRGPNSDKNRKPKRGEYVKGSWWMKCYVGPKGERKCIRESLDTTDEKEAIRREVLREKALWNELVNPKKPVVVEANTECATFWEAYVEHRKDEGKRPLTREGEAIWWRKFLAFAHPITLKDISFDVNIPRQSRGLYGVSRSKRLWRDANAARLLGATLTVAVL